MGRFLTSIQREALKRQGYKCAACGTRIYRLGRLGADLHKYGESAQGHHIKHAKVGGKDTVENCVIICQSCHYSVHEGGNYRHGKIVGKPSDYYHYSDKPALSSEERKIFSCIGIQIDEN
ncbi:HNH endonuclease [Azospirillum argentinense]